MEYKPARKATPGNCHQSPPLHAAGEVDDVFAMRGAFCPTKDFERKETIKNLGQDDPGCKYLALKLGGLNILELGTTSTA